MKTLDHRRDNATGRTPAMALLVILSVWLGHLSPAVAQGAQTAVDIIGEVLPAPGERNVDESVFVTLRSLAGGFQATTVASQGRFQFSGVPGGSDYLVIASSTGRHPSQETIHGWGTMSAHHVSLQLGARLEQKPGPAAGQAVVSVKTLLIPEKAIEKVALATEEIEKKEYDKAVRHLEEAVQIHPDFTHAYNNLGVAYLRMNKTADAEAAFVKAVQTDPASLIAQRNLGYFYMGGGKPESAIQPLSAAVKLDPLDARLNLFLGEALFLVGKTAEAQQWLEKSRMLDPENPQAHYRLGWIQMRLQLYPEALLSFREFLKRNKDMDTDQVQKIVAQLEKVGVSVESPSAAASTAIAHPASRSLR